jgi:hypothetical protein
MNIIKIKSLNTIEKRTNISTRCLYRKGEILVGKENQSAESHMYRRFQF